MEATSFIDFLDFDLVMKTKAVLYLFSQNTTRKLSN